MHKIRDANPLQNSGWFGLWVSKICHFGFGFGFSKIQLWVWVRVQGLKIFQKTGFWVQVWVGFCKKHQNSSEIALEKLFFLYIKEI
jgi:hypothetical protein